jgi:hypothetical protein
MGHVSRWRAAFVGALRAGKWGWTSPVIRRGASPSGAERTPMKQAGYVQPDRAQRPPPPLRGRKAPTSCGQLADQSRGSLVGDAPRLITSAPRTCPRPGPTIPLSPAAWCLFVALLLLAAPAVAQPCGDLLGAGPLLSAPGSADFGQIPEACPGSDLFLRLRGELLADKPDFYGVITAGATLRARYRLGDSWTVTAALDPATWRLPINAVVSSSAVDFGPGTLGAQRSFLWSRTALAVYGRVLLPFDTARHYGTRWGAELGVSAARRTSARTAVRAGLTLPATLVVVDRGNGLFLPGALLEGAFTPRPWLQLAAGTAVRTEMAPEVLLSALALRGSARLQSRRGWHGALGVDLPLVGKDRTDLIVSLFFGRGGPRQEAR